MLLGFLLCYSKTDNAGLFKEIFVLYYDLVLTVSEYYEKYDHM